MAQPDVYALHDNVTLYETLGVGKDASENEIRKAYLRLAVQYHPDKNPGGAERFKEISFAHGILSDADQRRMYDNRTLLHHVEGEARAYDPMMDPSVELTSEQLRFFVERLRKQEEDDAARQQEFARKLKEEMQRRASYDERNPHFRPAPAASVPLGRTNARESHFNSLPNRHNGGDNDDEHGSLSPSTNHHNVRLRTTAEMLTSLRGEDASQSTVAGKGASTGERSGAPSGPLSMRERMLQEFRSKQAKSNPSSNPNPKPDISESPLRSKLQFVREQEEKEAYSRLVEERITAASDFDYRTFVEKDLIDGGVIDDAILSDAMTQARKNKSQFR